MLRVPDVQATIDWYVALGFELTERHEEDGILNWAHLSLVNLQSCLMRGDKLRSSEIPTSFSTFNPSK